MGAEFRATLGISRPRGRQLFALGMYRQFVPLCSLLLMAAFINTKSPVIISGRLLRSAISTGNQMCNLNNVSDYAEGCVFVYLIITKGSEGHAFGPFRL